MKILLTGGTGLTGSATLALLPQKHDIYAICRPGSDPPRLNRVRWVEHDLSEPLGNAFPARIDAVIHLAQSREYREFPNGAVDVFEVNAGATVRLLRWCVQAGGSRFVYASSGAVYRPLPRPLREDDTTAPGNFYAFSKLVGEQALHQFRDVVTVTTLRFFFIYGAGQRGMLIPGLIDKVVAGESVPLAGTRGIRINPIYVQDAAAAVVAALAMPGSGTFNVAGPETVALRDVAELIAAELAVGVSFSHESEKPDLVADTRRMRERLWQPATGVREGLRRVLGSRHSQSGPRQS